MNFDLYLEKGGEKRGDILGDILVHGGLTVTYHSSSKLCVYELTPRLTD